MDAVKLAQAQLEAQRHDVETCRARGEAALIRCCFSPFPEDVTLFCIGRTTDQVGRTQGA